MEVAIAAIVGGIVGYFLCKRKGCLAVPPAKPPEEYEQQLFEDESWTPGVPDGNKSEIVDEAESAKGVDPGTTTFETDEIIERDVGDPVLQQGADAIEATHGRDAATPFAPRPSVGSLAAFNGAFPAAPTDPGADPSDVPIE